MDENLYDEFGNYIGPELEDDEEDDDWYGDRFDADSDGEPRQESNLMEIAEEMEEDVAERQIILHEDKKYYPDADEVYPEAETLLQEEDTQPITEPIIAPVRSKDFDLIEKTMPETSFSYDYLAGMMEHPDLVRNVAIIGNMHHGKTLFMDLLVRETHTVPKKMEDKEWKYTDSRKDEQERHISIKSVPMSLVLPDSKQKSYLVHLMDTPGHVNFQDEVTAALRIADGAVLIVDAVIGLTAHCERMLKHVIQEGLNVTLVINAIDRLVLDLKLPPTDAYHKLRHTIEEVNAHIDSVCKSLGKEPYRLSPLKNNVIFASGLFGFCFSLDTFAQMYAETFNNSFDPKVLAKCLWGNLFFSEEKRSFTKTAAHPDMPRSFVHFILEPLYKLVGQTMGEEQEQLAATLADVGVFLAKKDFKLETKLLLKRVMRAFFGPPTAFVDMVRDHVPSPKQNALAKTEHIYSGDMQGDLAKDMKSLNAQGYLMLHTVKCYHRPDCTTFDLYGRVMSGTIYKGDRVKVLGEAFSLDDDEDLAIKEVENLWIYQGRYRVEVSHVPAGNWVLIGGVDESIAKTSTITTANNEEEIEIFHPLKFNTTSCIKVACEPLNPSELPKMVQGLRRIDKAYPLATTKVEESGEHVIIGTGELYMDCILHDVRKLYGDLEIKIADPVVTFMETVVESSAMKCFAETPNKKNKIYMVSEPLEKGVGEDIENGVVSIDWDQRQMGDYFTKNYEWDLLAARSIWAFGPDARGPNVLVDDTLPTDVDKVILNECKESLIQGFQWATREGPLCDESIRSVKFKILDAQLTSDANHRGGGQMIPTARRCAYSSFLLATPRLMEPMLFAEVECPADCVAAIYNVLARRRGHVTKDLPKPGSPLFTVHCYLPAIESFGFETDLRLHTSGQAMVMSCFDNWAIVPGDPLDKTIMLRPLEPAPAPHLAREFMLKTRRRKGLSEDVSIHKFFDDNMMHELAKHDQDLQDYF